MCVHTPVHALQRLRGKRASFFLLQVGNALGLMAIEMETRSGQTEQKGPYTNGFWLVALWWAVPNPVWQSVSTFQEIHSNACSEWRWQILACWWCVVCMKNAPVIKSNSWGVKTSKGVKTQNNLRCCITIVLLIKGHYCCFLSYGSWGKSISILSQKQSVLCYCNQ